MGSALLNQSLEADSHRHTRVRCLSLQLHDGAHLGVSAERGRRLHLPLPPSGAAHPEAEAAAGLVQEDARQGDHRARRHRLQGAQGGGGSAGRWWGGGGNSSFSRCPRHLCRSAVGRVCIVWRSAAAALTQCRVVT